MSAPKRLSRRRSAEHGDFRAPRDVLRREERCRTSIGQLRISGRSTSVPWTWRRPVLVAGDELRARVRRPAATYWTPGSCAQRLGVLGRQSVVDVALALADAARREVAGDDGDQVRAGRLICSSIVLCAPLPSATIVMTAPTPMIMPSIVSMVRILLRFSAFSAMRNVIKMDM